MGEVQLSVGIDDPLDRGGRHMPLISLYSNVLRSRVMFEDLNGLPYPAWMPSLDVGDELGIVPQDDVNLLMRVLNDARLVIVTSTAMGFVFVESGGEFPASLTKVHFAACAGNLVYSRSMSVLVGLGEVVDIVGCCTKDLDLALLVRGAAQVQEGDRRRFLTGLTLGIGHPLVQSSHSSVRLP